MSQQVTNGEASLPGLCFLIDMTQKNQSLFLRKKLDEKGVQEQDEKTGKKKFEVRPWLYIPVIAAIGGVLGAVFSLMTIVALGATRLAGKVVQYFKPGTYTQEDFQENGELLYGNMQFFATYVSMSFLWGLGGVIVAFIVSFVAMPCKKGGSEQEADSSA